jgi:probable F420-dependent oxidoreductase
MTTTADLRARLRRVGIWMPPPKATGKEPAELAAAIEQAGFTSVWVGGGNAAPADFAALRGLLEGSERLIVAPGIANIWAWDVLALRAEAERLANDFPGRFILGLGVSHAPLVENLGQQYVKPLAKMEKFLDELDHPAQSARTTPGGAGGAGAAANADTAGGRELPPVVLAALGPKMLELSAARDGAHPYFTTPEHTRFARDVLGAAPLLVPEQAVTLTGSQADGLAGGRAYAGRYLKMPNYTRNLKKFGFTDADITGGGSDQLISAIIPSGAPAALARVREHLDAGADHVVIQPLTADGTFASAQIAELADVVAEQLL